VRTRGRGGGFETRAVRRDPVAKVQIWVEVSEEHFHRYEGEARRRGVAVETLVAHTVNCLLKEFEDEERECPDRLHLMS